MGDEESLRQVVEDQAQARVRGDFAKFASYMTPQAVLRMHRQGEPLRGRGIRGYEIVDLSVRGAVGGSDVRYSGGGSYVMRTRWERPDGLWKAVIVEMPPDSIRSPWWRRMLGLGPRQDPPAPERRDLR